MPSPGSTDGVLSDITNRLDVSQLGHLKLSTTSESLKWFGNYLIKQTNSLLKTKLGSALTSLATTISPTNFLIKTLTGGLINTTSSSPGKINLEIKAKTSSQGTITTVRTGPGISLFYPGTKTSDRGGLLPNYNKQLGVFYITQTPKIENTQSSRSVGAEYEVDNILKIDLNSFQVVINPVVSKSCSKIKVSKQIVLTTSQNNASVSGTLIDSRNYEYRYIGAPSSTLEFIYKTPRPLPIIETPKVRITIAMTPIGRTDPILLIKEFDATLIQDIYRPTLKSFR